MRQALAVLLFSAGVASAFDFKSYPSVTGSLTINSTLSLPDGTAAAPSLRFTADTDVGLWRPGANQASLSTNGVERLRLDAAGNVAITDGGNTDADVTAGKVMAVRDGGASGPTYVAISTGANTAPALINLLKTRSTAATGDANTVIVNGDSLGEIRAMGSDGTLYQPAASIVFAVDALPGALDMPGRIVFNTTADGAISVTERMRITEAGNVGIGTTAPGGQLEVDRTSGSGATAIILRTSDATGANSAIRWQGSASNNQAGIASNFNVSDNGAIEFLNVNTTNMIIRSGGNVGIGTATPGQQLHVQSGSQFTGTMTVASSATFTATGVGTYSLGTSSGISVGAGHVSLPAGAAANPSLAASGDLNNGLFFPAADVTAITTSGSERLRVDSSGNVGIGTTVPATNLHVFTAGGVLTTLRVGNGNGNTEVLTQAGGESVLRSVGGLPLYLGTNSTTKLTILSGGNVGIGDTSPGGKLEVVSGGAGETYSLLISSTNGSTNELAWDTANDELEILGSVVINATSASSLLHVAGSFQAATIASTSTTNVGVFTVDSASGTVEGNLRLGSAGSYAEFQVGTSTPSTDSNFGRIWTVNNAGTAEVKVLDGAGNVTQISPHNAKGEWVFDSQNVLTGKHVYINMESFIRDMERLTGNRYILEGPPR